MPIGVSRSHVLDTKRKKTNSVLRIIEQTAVAIILPPLSSDAIVGSRSGVEAMMYVLELAKEA